MRGGIAKNRNLIIENESGKFDKIRIDELAKSLSSEDWEPCTLSLSQPKTVWVATLSAKVSGLKGERTFAIVMNASSWEAATDINYFITNVDKSQITAYGGSYYLFPKELGRSFLSGS